MNPLSAYLHDHLERDLRQHRVVVWYDAARDFEPFVTELIGTDAPGPAPVVIGKTKATLARYAGSYFALRMEVEPRVADSKPEPLLIYLPGEKPPEKCSPLLELELAGTRYAPELPRVAKQLLKRIHTDGRVDELLGGGARSYTDLVALLLPDDSGATSGSALKLVFEKTANDPVGMLAHWLADETTDAAIEAKGGRVELLQLIAVRSGLNADPAAPWDKTRADFARYLFLNEFRHDLRCPPPASISAIPTAPSADHRKFNERLLDTLRRQHAACFERFADTIEAEFNLAHLGIDAPELGSIDTFRFEEQAMLRHVDERLVAGHYAQVAALVAEHRESHWARQDLAARQAQWDICARLAELGAQLDKTDAELKEATQGKTEAAALAELYTAKSVGWHTTDRLHRKLEEAVAGLATEPEAEKSLAVLRMRYDTTVREQARGFGAALAKAHWAVEGILPQTQIYPKKVAPLPGKVAWFMVDALRFEMGAELAHQLPEALEQELTPAVAVLPSITPLGMAALLPGAAADFAVVEAKGSVAARLGTAVLTDADTRMKYLKSQVPDCADILLGDLLHRPPSKVEERIGAARLLVVRSQEIDALGETGEIVARQGMGMIIQNLVRAVRKLSGLGYERFVITADHGHQFALHKSDDMKVEAPTGTALELHRRCWIGRGPSVPAGTVAVSATELGYSAPMDFVFPQSTGVFKAGGGLAYHHGGFSLQELIIPVLSFRMPKVGKKKSGGPQITLTSEPTIITNRVFTVNVEATGDLLRTEPVRVRVSLVSDGEEVGFAGMAVGAQLDRESKIITLEPNKLVSVGLMLAKEGVESLQIVVQDAGSSAVYAESKKLSVKVKQ